MPSRPIRVRLLIPISVLLLLPVLLLWRVVFLHDVFLPADLLKDIAPWKQSGTTAPWNALLWDGIAQFYPWRLFAAATERHGYLPFWNPHEFCGTPFAANSQSAIFYPPNVLFALMPVKQAFGVSVLLHLFLTGIFLYTFLRRAHGCRMGAALAGAVTWQLCTWQVSWLALPTFMCVSTWIPAALLFVDGVAKRPRAQTAAGLGAVLGMMILAGHLQICFYGLLLTMAYGIFRFGPVILSDATRRGAVMTAAATVVAVTFLLGIVQIMPSLELSHMSHRTGGRPTWQSYQAYTAPAVPFFHLATLVMPQFFGTPSDGSYWSDPAYSECACYVGSLGFVLAIVGIVCGWRKSREVRFFGTTAVIAILFAIGTPLNAILYFGVPGYSETGSPGRILVIWSLCAAVLAAAGMDRILVRGPGSIKPAFAAAAGVILVITASSIAGIWNAFAKLGQPGALTTNLMNEPNPGHLPLVILFASGLAIWRYRSGHLSVRTFSATLVLIVAADLLSTGVGFNHTAKASDVYPDTPITSYLRVHEGIDRVMPVNRTWSINPQRLPTAVLPPNTGTVYGFYDTQGYDSLFPGQYMTYISRVNDDGRSPAPDENGNMVFTRGFASKAAQVLAPRYVIALDNGELQRIPTPQLRPLVHDNGVTLYDNPLALPRYELAESGQPLAALQPSPTRLTITLPVTPGVQYTVIDRDQWYPGWHAFIDGHEHPIFQGPFVFRALHCTAPRNAPHLSRISFVFRPSTEFAGIYCLCLGWSVIFAVCACALIRRGG